MASSIRVLSTEDRTWQLQDGDKLPRDLPAWLRLYCWLNPSCLFAWVALCISLGGAGFNLISGNRTEDWIVPFGVFFPAIFLITGSVGVSEARKLLSCLRNGILVRAVITHCTPAAKSPPTIHAGTGAGGWQVRIPLGKTTATPQEMPAYDYIQQIRDQHLARFDAQGAYIGTQAERLVTLVHAVILGAGLGIFAGIISGLRFDKVFLVVLVTAVVCAVIENRKKYWLRLTAGQRLDSQPLGSKAVKCRLEIVDGTQTPTQFYSVLDLAGDERDFAPKSVLHDGSSPEPLLPSKIMIPNRLDETANRLSFQETGLRVRLSLAVLAGLAVTIVWLGAM